MTNTKICTGLLPDKAVILVFSLLLSTFLSAQTTITSLQQITNPAGSYIITDDINAAGFDAPIAGFTGTLTSAPKQDGTFPVISNLSVPIFATATDATISNIILDAVNISYPSSVGAICCTANGATRIYNCGILGGEIRSTGGATDNPKSANCCGSLVGLLDGTSRVINCFSYATITGGNRVGGIVGYNNGTTTSASINTMIMNCMFYGDITGGNKVSPVYGGNNIDNTNSTASKGLNNFNYYVYSQLTANIDFYNCALAVEDKHLTHFEYYRLFLNSNRKLAAWYASTSNTTVNPTDMAKWVLETADRSINNPHPYPILKTNGKYPSIINFDDEHAPLLSLVDGKPSEFDRNKGGKFGTLTVNIEDHTSGNGSRSGSFITVSSKTLPITDKDFDRYNYNYYKVRLPYFNEVGSGNYTDNKVVTGWIITSMTGATPTQATSGEDVTINNGVVTATPYNFADRTCTKFEDGSYRVFSQGAYFDVPDGVTAITIQPYWANASFVSDQYLDKIYNTDYGNAANVTIEQYKNKTTYTINGTSIKVYTSISDAVGGISTKGPTVYDNAIVLVGNFHQGGIPYANKVVPFTIMSADFDNDNEPDFSFIYHHTDRKEISPIRFDFINVIGTAMAQKPNGSSKMCNAGIFKPYGWFEVTNTALMRFGQYEYSFNSKVLSPTIFLGGEIEQIVSNNSGNGIDQTNKTSYFIVGANAWFKEFNVGTHSDKTQPTPHRPISVTGGRFEKFYLSGIYQPKVNAVTDNAECYINGGSFGEVAGAGQEQIKGNITWIIDYADIDNFYGGGINAAKPVTGNIGVTIRNSWVDVYCGGPKFGDMGSDKTVKTQATGCVFRRFFGAGYGGNSYNRVIVQTKENTQPWGTWQQEYTNNRGKYSLTNNGIPTSFEYEYFIGSKGTIWGRFYVNYASFSKATVHNVTSELTGCEITGDFYGGGSLGVVDGTATSVLDGCTVLGSVFGGGYSATIPNIDIMSGGFATNPGYNSSAGIFTPAVFPTSDPYEWETHSVSNNVTALGTGTIYTPEDLTNLGVVSNVNLTITGNTLVKGDIHTYNENGEIDEFQTVSGGGVFGGGDASSIGTNTIVTIDNIAQSNQKDIFKVFGGGNKAGVNGNTNVTLTSGTVIGGVYGGCNDQGNIGGNTSISLNGGFVGTTSAYADIFGGGFGSATTISGNVNVTLNGATIYGDIYGGSALGSVNDVVTDITTVNILSGVTNGNIYGGGMGEAGTENVAKGQVNGTVTVNIGTTNGQQTPTYTGNATLFGSVYGCNNTNGSPQGNVTVNIYSTAHTTTDAVGYTDQNGTPTFAIANVFGGGRQADYTPASDQSRATVYIHGCDNTIEDLFGGGDAAAAYGVVTIVEGGRFNRIFGGGNGENVPADIGAGGTDLQVHGGNIGQLFGGSNTNGVITGPMNTTVDSEGPCGQVDITEFFSGNNLASIGTAENPTSIVATIGCGTNFGDVYGGCNLADIYGDITLNIVGGTIDRVFGGSKGSSSTPANIYGNVTLNITGGGIDNAFGGSNINGNISGSIQVNVNKGTDPCVWSIGNIYGASNDAAYSPTADGNSLTVNIINGDINGSVYGGGKGATATVTANPTVVIGDGNAEHSVIITQNVYGGGDAAAVDGNTQVTYNDNNAAGHVANLFGGGNAAGVSGTATVNMMAGTVNTGIYGGCNSDGNVQGAISVNIYGGTLGIESTPLASGIFGGGYGQNTTTSGNVTVTIGDLEGNYTPVVYGDIYGGSALGNVNNETTDLTKVDFLNGTLHGNLYGGGLGSNEVAAKEIGRVEVNIGANGQSSCAIDLSDASVFGCNNTNGSPQDNVSVNIYCTGHDEKNAASYSGNDATFAIGQVFGGGNQADYAPDNGDESSSKKATVHIYGCTNTIGYVFGGGNAAAAIGVVTVIDGGRIGDVFGGGNGAVSAANIGAGGTNLQIHGGNIGQLFGGSNKNGTIVGNMDVSIDSDGDCGQDMFIAEFFCGNNEAALNTDIVATIGCGTHFGDVYGGCNLADMTGNVTLNIEGGRFTNVYGGSKGSNADAADITGSVTLNIKGGYIEQNAFGGSNINGNISGAIIVNLDWMQSDCTDGQYIGNVYGGSNLATYTPSTPGSYPEVNIKNGTVSGNVYGGGKGTTAIVTSNPHVTVGDATQGYTAVVTGDVYGGGDAAQVNGIAVVNVINKSSTNIGNVYGGGNAADVLATIVTIDGGTITGDVYGGGHGDKASLNEGDDHSHSDQTANVNGNVNVTVTGGTINRVFAGANTNGDITGDVSVTVNKGTNSGDMHIHELYGGGNMAAGNAGVIHIGCTGGTGEGIDDVYGGANQADIGSADSPSNIALSITGGSIGRVFGGNNTSGTIYGSIQVDVNWATGNDACGLNSLGSVFGGGNQAAYSAPTATPDYPVVNIKNGTVTNNVFGGGLGSTAVVTGNPQVTIGDATEGYAAVISGDVYGGGDAAAVTGTPVVRVINKSNTSIGSVYGGGNAADVSGTNVTIDGGTIDMVFGGGHGDKNTEPQKQANVNGNVNLNVTGGTINQVFGASNSKGSISGNISVNVNKGADSGSMYIKELYGGGNEAEGKLGTITIGNTGTLTQGHSNLSTTNRIGYELEGIGDVYGGSRKADNTGVIILNIRSGIINRVFGGNNISGSVAGAIQVDINKDDSNNNDWYIGYVYGGGNQAAYGTAGNNYPLVNIINGTVTNNVYGGGLGTTATVTANPRVVLTGGTVTGNVFGGGDAAAVTGNPAVNMSDGAVNGNIFGGGNQADVTGNPTVALTGGTTSNVYGGGLQGFVDGNNTVRIEGGTVNADVYGGGMQGDVSGDVTVNISSSSLSGNTNAVTITGSVYGGGALANTNTANRSITTVNENPVEVINLGDNSKKTVVNLYPGATINGDVYGGGKGKAPTPGDPGEAIVYGNVTVYQFGAVLVPQYSDDLATSGRIFGCNNVNGSPRGHALVYIKKTARNQAMTGLYDLAAVYGGGNMAEYLPYNHATDNSDFAEVMIDPDDCDDITIHSVYGGGNAASTPATKVTINGGEIEYTFGGGNGAGEGNLGANVGYHAYSEHTGSSEEDIAYRQEHYMYGSGQATTNILGGTIHHIYGGSNTLGNVRHASIIKLDGVGTCPLVVDDEMHGGGREAYMEGKALIDLGCITGMNEIYGGSEKADVGGDIELTITSGTYGKVFGGNNKGGRVYGSITLNIEQTGCLPIVIDELYLGGNNAPYSVYGYTDQTTTVDIGGEEIIQYQPKTRQQYISELSGGDPDYDPDQDPNYHPYNDPMLNIRSFDRIGTVFGGGNGEHATMIGNPTVDINVTQGYIDGKYAGDEPEYQSYKVSGVLQENGNPKYGVIETVFGGGNEADVIGTTNIRIGDKTGSQVTLKSTNQSEEVKGATITGNVYGGGNEADVTDGTNIKVGPDE